MEVMFMKSLERKARMLIRLRAHEIKSEDVHSR